MASMNTCDGVKVREVFCCSPRLVRDQFLFALATVALPAGRVVTDAPPLFSWFPPRVSFCYVSFRP